MIVHNLTDYSLPYRKPRKSRDLKIKGRVIKPGKSEDIPDHLLQPSDIAGWITANEASIDGVPEWYQEARRKAKDAEAAKTRPKAVAVKEAKEQQAEEPKEEPKAEPKTRTKPKGKK